VEHAVHAEADAVALLVRLDVDIGGPHLDGRQQDVVAQLHDGRVVGRPFQIQGVDVVVGRGADFDLLLDLVHHLVDVELVLLLVVLLDGGGDAHLGRDHHLDVVAGDELEVVDGQDVRRVRDGDDEGRAGPVYRNHTMALDDLLRHQGDDLPIDVELGEVDGRNAVLLGQELGEVIFLDGPHLDERVTQALARFSALLLSALKLLG